MQNIIKILSLHRPSPHTLQLAGTCPFPTGNLDPSDTKFLGRTRESASPKRHLDQFIRFCTAQPYAQRTRTHTTLRATCVEKGRTEHSVRTMQPSDYIKSAVWITCLMLCLF